MIGYKSSIVLLLFLAINIGCSKTGIKKTKYENGQTKEQYTVVKDKDGRYLWDGEYSCWYENGQIKATGTYSRCNPPDTTGGKTDIPMSGRVGKWILWHENGQKAEECSYKDGKEEGTLTQWYENGQKKQEDFGSIHTNSGQIVTRLVEWYENGQEKLENSENCGDGGCTGMRIEWFDNGQKKLEYHHNNDMRITWYKNGQKESEGINLPDGSRPSDGLHTEWYENGQKKEECTYNDHGNKDGPCTEWYENGLKAEEGTYTDGRRGWSGTRWLTTGEVYSQMENGRLIYEKGLSQADLAQ